MLKIYRSEKEITGSIPDETGVMDTDGKTYLRFSCADGFIRVKELQLEGKKKMGVADFLRGFRK